MQPDLVTFFHNLADLSGERFRRVRGREPCRFDAVLVPELQEAVDADCGAEDAAGDVGGVCGFAVAGVYPGWILSERVEWNGMEWRGGVYCVVLWRR